MYQMNEQEVTGELCIQTSLEHCFQRTEGLVLLYNSITIIRCECEYSPVEREIKRG